MDYRDIIRNNPGLIWYTKDYDRLSEASVVEAVLNYGNWGEVQDLIKSLGMLHVAEIFDTYAFRPRTNYFPQIRNYFHLYFEKYAR